MFLFSVITPFFFASVWDYGDFHPWHFSLYGCILGYKSKHRLRIGWSRNTGLKKRWDQQKEKNVRDRSGNAAAVIHFPLSSNSAFRLLEDFAAVHSFLATEIQNRRQLRCFWSLHLITVIFPATNEQLSVFLNCYSSTEKIQLHQHLVMNSVPFIMIR